MSHEFTRHRTDPDGRDVVFDSGSHPHLAEGLHPWLLDHVETILGAIARPDYREDDRRADRERFYRADFPEPGRWLRVVVDFNDAPARVVSAFDQETDSRLKRQ